MKVKNYTSSVPVYRTIARIEEHLVAAGATGISKDYNAGDVTALCFYLKVEARQQMIRLPINHDAVFQHMRKEKPNWTKPGIERLKEQSLRTSWKLMQDWVEVQLALINISKVDVLEVFLPYVWDGRRTYYGALKEAKFRALPEPEIRLLLSDATTA